MKTLRDYQTELSERGVKVLRSKNIIYLSMEVRTGKTATALNVAKLYGAKNVLFLTKKKAVSSIESDYVDFGFDKDFKLTVTNNESMHKIQDSFDLVVHDESHRFGSFPKPSKGAKMFKLLFGRLPLILLSGTPTPEGYSQIYHQFWVSMYSPFGEATFYKWAKEYVKVYQVNYGYGLVNQYNKANIPEIKKVIDPYMISLTQKEAGFSTEVKENILYCRMDDITYILTEKLRNELVIQGKEELIMGDTAVKLMSKLHQLYSGTIKFESGKTKVIDYTKAQFIFEKFEGKKIGIFYKFKAEFEALKDIFGDRLTGDIFEFDNTEKSIALQIVSGREGISLKNADYLVYYNMDHSATSYWQSRDRLTTMERKLNDVFFIFTKDGIEENIYKSVIKKKSYTTSHFKRDYNVQLPNKNNQTV
jgi:hypothetical protein